MTESIGGSKMATTAYLYNIFLEFNNMWRVNHGVVATAELDQQIQLYIRELDTEWELTGFEQAEARREARESKRKRSAV